MSLYEEQRTRENMNRVWRGVIATTAADFDERIAVTIPDLDPNLRIEGCRWQARDAVSLPARGDTCLVIFDNNKEAWVVCWWPF